MAERNSRISLTIDALVRGLDDITRLTGGLSGVDTEAAEAAAELKRLADELRRMSANAFSMDQLQTELAQTQAQLRALQAELERLKKRLDNPGGDPSERARRGFRQTTIAAEALDQALIGIGAALSATEIVRGTAQIESLNLTFETITGSAEAAAAEMAFIRKEADRLGLDSISAGRSYSQFLAAVQGTAVEGQAARDVFTAVTASMAKLGKSSYDTEGALLALQQIASKGTLSSEELRQQLGERLPGAFNIAARAMGVTTAQLSKMLEQGLVPAADFLPAFADELNRTFDNDAAERIDTLAGALNRLKNSGTDALTSFEQAGGAGFLAGAFEKAGVALQGVQYAAGFLGIKMGKLVYEAESLAQGIAEGDLEGHFERAEAAAESEREQVLDLQDAIFGVGDAAVGPDKAGKAMENATDDAEALGDAAGGAADDVKRIGGSEAVQALNQLRATFKTTADSVGTTFDNLREEAELRGVVAQTSVVQAQSEVAVAQAALESAEAQVKLTGYYSDHERVKDAKLKLDEKELELARKLYDQAKVDAGVEADKLRFLESERSAQQSLLQTLEKRVRAVGEASAADQKALTTQRERVTALDREVAAQRETAKQAETTVKSKEAEVGAREKSYEAAEKEVGSVKAAADALSESNAEHLAAIEAQKGSARASGQATAATGKQTAAQGDLSAAVGKTNQGLSASAQLVKQVIDNTYALSIAAGDALVNKKEQVGLYQDENAEVEKLQRNLNKMLDLQRDNATRTINMADGLNRFLQKANDIQQRFYESSLQVERLEQSVRDMRESGEIDLGRLEQAATRAETGFQYVDSVQLDGLRGEIENTFELLERRVDSAQDKVDSFALRLARLRGEDVNVVELEAERELAELEEQRNQARGEERDLLDEAIRQRQEILDIEREQAEEREKERERQAREERERAQQDSDEDASAQDTRTESDDEDTGRAVSGPSALTQQALRDLEEIDQAQQAAHERDIARQDELKAVKRAAADDEISQIERVQSAADNAASQSARRGRTTIGRLSSRRRAELENEGGDNARSLNRYLIGIRSVGASG